MIDFNTHALLECIFTQASTIWFQHVLHALVDLMHEVELGIWKAVFVHLLRILDCENEGLKHELDRRRASFETFRRLSTDIPLGFKKYLLSGLMG